MKHKPEKILNHLHHDHLPTNVIYIIFNGETHTDGKLLCKETLMEVELEHCLNYPEPLPVGLFVFCC